jgi:ComF family protein
VSLFEYTSEIKELINAYKFKSERRLAALFADFFAVVYFRKYKGIPVVPVPLRKNAKKKRGWDQVEEILHHCRKKYGIHTLKLLQRKGNRQQKSLNYQERLNNVSSSILLKNTKAAVPTILILFDDIFTTGATVSECARVLKKAGAEQVYAVTIEIDQ